MSTLLTKISSGIANIGYPSKSNFSNSYDSDMDLQQWVIFVIVFLLMLLLLMFLGSIIFNRTIPKIVPSIRKVSTLDFFGLYVILHILFC